LDIPPKCPDELIVLRVVKKKTENHHSSKIFYENRKTGYSPTCMSLVCCMDI